MPSVELAKKEGEVSDYVDAVIEEDGRLQVIRNSFGPGDYETEVTAAVAAEDKERLLLALGERAPLYLLYARRIAKEDIDRLLLALLKKVYGGNTRAVEAFTEFARSKGIPVDWFRWP